MDRWINGKKLLAQRPGTSCYTVHSFIDQYFCEVILMTEQKETKLKHKIEDYRRFAFILLALSGFLLLGMVLPNETVQASDYTLLIVMTGVLVVAAVSLHASSIKTEKVLYQDDE
ncbi:hypothetical protein CR194_01180 [Salipaludibacillus keqinensis]|uniref:Uncharacterized protein n=1 Tax=Salipaludibacillus keqinensis TaxID=2045207 RepID=A0A323TI23_9BACI|nr:YrhC family protein [Salipaludibacillus keqinensis]PYZ94180.1 hypothetical protein CR194_01180 [Salipaludibacillus keqinensis]